MADMRCDCGKEILYSECYRCRICNVRFCEDCSLEHFSLYEDNKGHVKPKSLLKSIWWIKKKDLKDKGFVVQLVRTLDCLSRGCGFKSRQGR